MKFYKLLLSSLSYLEAISGKSSKSPGVVWSVILSSLFFHKKRLRVPYRIFDFESKTSTIVDARGPKEEGLLRSYTVIPIWELGVKSQILMGNSIL